MTRIAALLVCLLSGAPAAGEERESRLYPVRKGGKWGFIDRTGALAVAPRFDAVGPFSEGLAAVREGRTLGYADRTGALLLVPEHAPAGDLHRPFSNGLAAVRSGGRVGFMDRTGALAIPARWLRAEDFSDGLSLACSEQGCGFVDPKGGYYGSDMFMGGRPFRNGFATVWLAMGMSMKRAVFVSRERGRIPSEYEDTGDYAEGLAPVRFRWRWGYVDERGQPVIPPRFEEAASFAEGLAAVRPELNGPCGYADRAGALAVPARFASCGPFRGGRARVRIAEPGEPEQVGFIDREGKLVIAGAKADPPFVDAGDFEGGLAPVGVGGALDNVDDGAARLGYIDASGRYVWPPAS